MYIFINIKVSDSKSLFTSALCFMVFSKSNLISTSRSFVSTVTSVCLQMFMLSSNSTQSHTSTLISYLSIIVSRVLSSSVCNCEICSSKATFSS